MNISPNKLIILSTIISLEIVKDKTIAEINCYKNLLNSICGNLQAYCNQQACFINENYKK